MEQSFSKRYEEHLNEKDTQIRSHEATIKEHEATIYQRDSDIYYHLQAIDQHQYDLNQQSESLERLQQQNEQYLEEITNLNTIISQHERTQVELQSHTANLKEEVVEWKNKVEAVEKSKE